MEQIKIVLIERMDGSIAYKKIDVLQDVVPQLGEVKRFLVNPSIMAAEEFFKSCANYEAVNDGCNQ